VAGTFSKVTANQRTNAAQSIEPVYYISGKLDVTGTGALQPILEMPGVVTDPIVPGEYAIEFRDSSQQLLLSVPFTAVFTDSEGVPQEYVNFHYQLPVQEDLALILLKHNDIVLDSIEPSQNPPLLVVTYPGDGDTLGGQEVIQWTAGDADGDPLQYSILYSPDEGDSWYPVANSLTETEYTIDVRLLPGGDGGQIQVIATDGFHTVRALSSGTFEVPHPAPTVVINSPIDEQSYQENEWISFSGSASDVAGSASNDFIYIWSIDGQDYEVGKKFAVQLATGEYELTLTAYDENDNYGVDSLIFRVLGAGNGVYLPMLQN